MVPRDLDRLDRGIIAALQVDGRRAYSRIADEVGVSESVIRYRVRRLEDAGILQIVGIADPLRIGFDLMALVGVKGTAGKLDHICDQLGELPEASYVIVTAGSFDLFVEVLCRDTAHFSEVLTEKIRTIDGVVDTQSFLVLQIRKMSYGWGVDEVETAPAQPEPQRTAPAGDQ
ncbi:MAG TPA: Lrp/AsnC family transcriptional regulator [Euzebyales bacterium]|nr:Lrp/AsnC family transcriptional regulator [Euzebyales bacterium]